MHPHTQDPEFSFLIHHVFLVVFFFGGGEEVVYFAPKRKMSLLPPTVCFGMKERELSGWRLGGELPSVCFACCAM